MLQPPNYHGQSYRHDCYTSFIQIAAAIAPAGHGISLTSAARLISDLPAWLLLPGDKQQARCALRAWLLGFRVQCGLDNSGRQGGHTVANATTYEACSGNGNVTVVTSQDNRKAIASSTACSFSTHQHAIAYGVVCEQPSETAVRWLQSGLQDMYSRYFDTTNKSSQHKHNQQPDLVPASDTSTATKQEYNTWNDQCSLWCHLLVIVGDEVPTLLQACMSDMGSKIHQLYTRPYLPRHMADKILVMLSRITAAAQQVVAAVAPGEVLHPLAQVLLPALVSHADELPSYMEICCSCFWSTPSVEHLSLNPACSVRTAHSTAHAEPTHAAAVADPSMTNISHQVHGHTSLSVNTWTAVQRADLAARVVASAVVLLAHAAAATAGSSSSTASNSICRALEKLASSCCVVGQKLASKPLPVVLSPHAATASSRTADSASVGGAPMQVRGNGGWLGVHDAAALEECRSAALQVGDMAVACVVVAYLSLTDCYVIQTMISK